MKITIEVEAEYGARYEEIFTALISSGGLSGVKAGQTIIHFDNYGEFRGIQLSYWPWSKRKA